MWPILGATCQPWARPRSKTFVVLLGAYLQTRRRAAPVPGRRVLAPAPSQENTLRAYPDRGMTAPVHPRMLIVDQRGALPIVTPFSRHRGGIAPEEGTMRRIVALLVAGMLLV